MKGRWTYLYRAVDKVGRTIDFYLSEKRDVTAAKHFFRKALKSVGAPRVDAYAASHRAVAELKSEGMLPRRVRVRCSKYLNNVIEIVFTQMTKTSVLAAWMGRDHITDFNFAVGHKDAVDQQFHQGAFLLKGRVCQPVLNPSAKRVYGCLELRQLGLMVDLDPQLRHLRFQGLLFLFQLGPSPLELSQGNDRH